MARRGEGIYLRGTTWWMDCFIGGIRHQRSLGKRISRAAALELAQVERADILRGKAGIGTKRKDATFDTARTKFEVWAVAERRAATARRYRQSLKELARAFSGKRLSEITTWALDLYKQKRTTGVQLTERPDGISEKEWARRRAKALRGAPIGVNRDLATLKTLFNRCKAWGLYEGENPVCAVRFRKEPKTRLRWLEPEEERRLVAECGDPLKTIVLVGLHTGLRLQAEALTLRWTDVDLKRNTLTVLAAYAKSWNTRTVPLNSTVRAALARHPHTGEFVFTKADGMPYRGVRGFAQACRRAGLSGVTPHTLRHTFASRLVMTGADLRTVQDLGGWKTIGMVERYSHLSPSHKAQAVERIAETFPCDIPYAAPSARAAGTT